MELDEVIAYLQGMLLDIHCTVTIGVTCESNYWLRFEIFDFDKGVPRTVTVESPVIANGLKRLLECAKRSGFVTGEIE